MKERKLKLATMIITLIFGLGCIGLGAAAATKAPTAVANTSKIDISMLGEPQADITIIGVLGSLGINNSPGYPVIWGTENTANPYYITLGPGTSRQIDYTGAQTLLSLDGRNPQASAAWTGLSPAFSETSGYCYLAYKITIKCLDSVDIKFALATPPVDTEGTMLIEEIRIAIEGEQSLFVHKNNKDVHVDNILNIQNSQAQYTKYKNLGKNKTATIEILLKTDRPLSEIFATADGGGIAVNYDIGLSVVANRG
ncbi:MAG TPA: hypothetical protein P5161_03765 [Eubacteriales bacterium]|jgi:hypothetical protein|nr:hypothetical protein [Eubacteriales bacterium]HRU84153.1 hypothetical protein [Eubacteriales bacterium]